MSDREKKINPGDSDRIYPDSSFPDKWETQGHESFGLMSINRSSTGGKGMNLFGSSIRHSQTLTIRIQRAVKRRSLNKNWIGTKGGMPLVELVMSPSQFADLITSFNVGEGVPVTLRYVDGKEMEACPEESQRQLFTREFKKDVDTAIDNAKRLIIRVTKFIEGKGSITKKDAVQVVSDLKLLLQDLESNMPFVQEQFTRAMDKTTTEVKHEVENFVNNKIASLGIQALNREVMQVLEAAEESETLRLPEHKE